MIDVVLYDAGKTVGSTVTSGGTSANTAIPTNSNGTTARAVLLTSTGTVHVKAGIDNTVAATANDLMIGTTPVAISTRGMAYIAYIQESSAAKLNIAPLEL
jgi:hypothetical protein